MSDNFKVGLALGGGGVRGFAHIGVLRVLEREGIPVSIITGTSMGALVGAAYALSMDVIGLEQKILKAVNTDEIKNLETYAEKTPVEEKRLLIERLSSFVKNMLLWNLRVIKKQLIDETRVEEVIKLVVGDGDFEGLAVPFACSACDLITGEKVILDEGPLSTAVLASCSLPGIFPPVKLKRYLLVDGGILGNIPVDVAERMGADFIIAVDVAKDIRRDEFNNGIDILFQADELKTYELSRIILEKADLIIRPEVEHFSWAEFSRTGESIRAGEKAAEAGIGSLKEAITRKRRRKFLKKLFFLR